MSSSYPGGLDNLINNIAPGDAENKPGEEHDIIHNKVADALNAVQIHLGVTASTDPSTIDFLIRNIVGGHHHDGVDSRVAPLTKWDTQVYTVYGDTGGYYIRNEQTGTQDYTTNDLTDISGIFNTASANLGTGNLYSSGGGIFLARPLGLGGVYKTKAPLQLYTQTMLSAGGWGTIIQAVTGFPTSGTEANPQPIITTYSADRLTLRDFALDCNNIQGVSGILTLRSTGTNTGGQFAQTLIDHIDISNMAGSSTGPVYAVGIQNGKSTDSTATSNLWIRNCHIYGGNQYSRCFATNVGDVHLLDGNNFRTSLGFVVWVNASTVRMVGESHYGKITGIGNTNTNANVHVESGSSVAIVGAYLDNVRDGPAVRGQGFKLAVIDTHVNGDGNMAASPNTSDVFEVQANDAFIANCDAVGVDGTHEFRSLVNVIGSPVALRVYGNRLTFGKAFWNGTAPTQHSGNVVIDNTTWFTDQEPLFLKAGTIGDSDFLQPQDGYQGFDTLHNRLYVRDGGNWLYTELG